MKASVAVVGLMLGFSLIGAGLYFGLSPSQTGRVPGGSTEKPAAELTQSSDTATTTGPGHSSPAPLSNGTGDPWLRATWIQPDPGQAWTSVWFAWYDTPAYPGGELQMRDASGNPVNTTEFCNVMSGSLTRLIVRCSLPNSAPSGTWAITSFILGDGRNLASEPIDFEFPGQRPQFSFHGAIGGTDGRVGNQYDGYYVYEQFGVTAWGPDGPLERSLDGICLRFDNGNKYCFPSGLQTGTDGQFTLATGDERGPYGDLYLHREDPLYPVKMGIMDVVTQDGTVLGTGFMGGF